MSKLYFAQNGEDDAACFSLDYHKWYMDYHNLDSLTLFEAKRETGTGYFFCKHFGQSGEVGECGKTCEAYKPNNGKNGRCNHYGYCYEQTDKKIKISSSPMLADSCRHDWKYDACNRVKKCRNCDYAENY